MTASATSKTAVDGVQNDFPAGMALESVSTNFVQTTYVKEPLGETIITPAQDGTDGSGITPPTAGVGIRGWLSGIYKLLQGPLITNYNGAQVTVIPAVTAGAYGTANMVVGGIMNFATILNTVNMGTLQSITLRFKGSVQATEFRVAIFSASPSGTFTDHVVAAIASADSATLLGIYKFGAASGFSNLGTHTVYCLDNVEKKIIGTSQSLFAVVTTTASALTNPLATTSDMSLTLACDW